MGMEGWDTDLFSRSLSPPVPFLFLILLCTVPADTAPRAEVPNSTEILVLIRDQASPVDSTLVEDLKASLVAQGLPPSRIHTLTSFKKRNGYWSLLPWLVAISDLPITPQWYLFLEPETRVDLRKFMDTVDEMGGGGVEGGTHFLGRLLKDFHPAITHHYKMGVHYPFLPSGFAMSSGLMAVIVTHLKTHRFGSDFSIDEAHELAMFISERLDVQLSHTDRFCALQIPFKSKMPFKSKEDGGENCATWTLDREGARQNHGLKEDEVLIGVKTTARFHKTRLPVLYNTWGKSSRVEIAYLSDDAHLSGTVETADLSKLYGVSINQKKGHCAKTDAILKYFIKYYDEKKWIVIVDDDTLLSVPNLMKVLNSYNASEFHYIGERYGYGHRASGSSGYDYITMGGGVALTRPAVLGRSKCLRCVCPSPDSPDDMQLGIWMRHLGVEALDEAGFHQSEPNNYHKTQLDHYQPVSFHRFEKSPTTREIDFEATLKTYNDFLTPHTSQSQSTSKFKSTLKSTSNPTSTGTFGEHSETPDQPSGWEEVGRERTKGHPAKEDAGTRFGKDDL
ncbi:hypothetical protein AAMO2058_001322200 [Amorphochlora amoebiformis]